MTSGSDSANSQELGPPSRKEIFATYVLGSFMVSCAALYAHAQPADISAEDERAGCRAAVFALGVPEQGQTTPVLHEHGMLPISGYSVTLTQNNDRTLTCHFTLKDGPTVDIQAAGTDYSHPLITNLFPAIE